MAKMRNEQDAVEGRELWRTVSLSAGLARRSHGRIGVSGWPNIVAMKFFEKKTNPDVSHQKVSMARSRTPQPYVPPKDR